MSDYAESVEHRAGVYSQGAAPEARELRKLDFLNWLARHDADMVNGALELAAQRANEGYRWGESCDDIARDIRGMKL